jgi:hypothetical protein
VSATCSACRKSRRGSPAGLAGLTAGGVLGDERRPTHILFGDDNEKVRAPEDLTTTATATATAMADGDGRSVWE